MEPKATTLSARRYRMAVKVEAMSLVCEGKTPRCACDGCHVCAPEHLALDHKFGDGKIHRALFRLGTGGLRLHKWVRDNWGILAPAGPAGMFDVMCHNCNVSKFNHPACPLKGRPHCTCSSHQVAA
jgi:hypothetical protein